MGADFYIDDYGDGGYYDGGGDIGAGDDFNYGYGYDTPGVVSPDGSAIAWGDIGAGSDFNYGYGFDAGLSPDYIPNLPDLPVFQGPSFADILVASDLFGEGAAFNAPIERDYFGNYTVIPDLPDLSSPSQFAAPSFYDYWQSPPYIPTFPDLPTPPAPREPGPHLPPACGQGTYHPYPIGHPQQDVCAPFPASSSSSQQKPPQQQSSSGSSGGSSASKPPQQQQQCPPNQTRDSATGQCKPITQSCPSGYCKHPTTGQCLPTPQGYAPHPQTQVCIPRCQSGTVYDQARGICVPQGQAISPLPESDSLGGLFGDLKNLPWWLFAGLGALLLLNKGDDGRTTTVKYRRAT